MNRGAIGRSRIPRLFLGDSDAMGPLEMRIREIEISARRIWGPRYSIIRWQVSDFHVRVAVRPPPLYWNWVRGDRAPVTWIAAATLLDRKLDNARARRRAAKSAPLTSGSRRLKTAQLRLPRVWRNRRARSISPCSPADRTNSRPVPNQASPLWSIMDPIQIYVSSEIRLRRFDRPPLTMPPGRSRGRERSVNLVRFAK